MLRHSDNYVVFIITSKLIDRHLEHKTLIKIGSNVSEFSEMRIWSSNYDCTDKKKNQTIYHISEKLSKKVRNELGSSICDLNWHIYVFIVNSAYSLRHKKWVKYGSEFKPPLKFQHDVVVDYRTILSSMQGSMSRIMMQKEIF